MKSGHIILKITEDVKDRGLESVSVNNNTNRRLSLVLRNASKSKRPEVLKKCLYAIYKDHLLSRLFKQGWVDPVDEGWRLEREFGGLFEADIYEEVCRKEICPICFGQDNKFVPIFKFSDRENNPYLKQKGKRFLSTVKETASGIFWEVMMRIFVPKSERWGKIALD